MTSALGQRGVCESLRYLGYSLEDVLTARRIRGAKMVLDGEVSRSQCRDALHSAAAIAGLLESPPLVARVDSVECQLAQASERLPERKLRRYFLTTCLILWSWNTEQVEKSRGPASTVTIEPALALRILRASMLDIHRHQRSCFTLATSDIQTEACRQIVALSTVILVSTLTLHRPPL